MRQRQRVRPDQVEVVLVRHQAPGDTAPEDARIRLRHGQGRSAKTPIFCSFVVVAVVGVNPRMRLHDEQGRRSKGNHLLCFVAVVAAVVFGKC